MAVHYTTSGGFRKIPEDPVACSKLVFRVRETLLLTPEAEFVMYLRHKNKGSLFIENRRCIFAGKKAPAGAHLVTQSLESTCSMCPRHKNRDSVFIKYGTRFWGGKKAPAGAHLDAPSLDNTDSVYVIHINIYTRHIENVCICNK